MDRSQPAPQATELYAVMNGISTEFPGAEIAELRKAAEWQAR